MAAKAASKTATKTTTKTTTTATKAAPKTVITPDPTPTTTTATTGTTLGFLDVPTIERQPWGILALVLNILVSGVGTIIAGAKVSNTGQIIKGVLQFIFVWTVLGWIWSIVDGVRIFTRSA